MARGFKKLLSIVLFPIMAGAGQAVAAPVKILALGSSLTQGYGLPPGTEFTVVALTTEVRLNDQKYTNLPLHRTKSEEIRVVRG